MSPEQQTIQYSLEQLRRSPWPQAPAEFGASAPPPEPAPIESIRPRRVSSHRWTCRLSSISLDDPTRDRAPILIHAIDADLAIPLQLYWLLRHRELILALLKHLVEDLGLDARLILPADLPSRWQAPFKRVRGVAWVEPKYPAGHYRMLPHVLGARRNRPAVLDAVAAVDLAMGRAQLRPVAIVDLDRREPVQFRVADRDDRLEALLPANEHTRWIAGPRWRRCEADRSSTIGDGELVYFADRDVPARQSPCIRCGWCEYICPTRCSPAEFLRAQRDRDLKRAHRAGIDSCIDCGLCTSVCPSDLPLNLFIAHLRDGASEAR